MEKAYTSPDITVFYDAKLCIHAAECVRGLPAVFDTSKKPWIDPNQATADEIAKVIHKCPSGALRYERSDGAQSETSDPASLAFVKDGPIVIRGTIELKDQQENVVFQGTRVALCRCGMSKNKPFCDRSHLAGFEAAALEGKLE
jgi:uncharacterized Fe-S cluster protein YjdI/CDGSH-type Zn-finger protein